MNRYVKKPVEVQAQQWDGSVAGATAIIDWIIGNGQTARFHEAVDSVEQPAEIHIDTLEGTMRASAGDFVICGVKNEFYSCKPDVFEVTYEEVGA